MGSTAWRGTVSKNFQHLDGRLVLPALCRQSAVFFRLGEEAAGNAELAKAVEELSVLAEARDPRLTHLFPAFQEVLAAQSRGDYLAVADLLEHAIALSMDP